MVGQQQQGLCQTPKRGELAVLSVAQSAQTRRHILIRMGNYDAYVLGSTFFSAVAALLSANVLFALSSCTYNSKLS